MWPYYMPGAPGQLARSLAPKNHHKPREAVPRSSRPYRDERAGGPHPPINPGAPYLDPEIRETMNPNPPPFVFETLWTAPP